MDAQQVENAIEIAWNPSPDPNIQSLRAQALEFLNQLRADPTAWQVCLVLFTRDPRPLEVVRHFSLEVVNNAVQEHRLDAESLGYIKENLMGYIRQMYTPGSRQDTVDTAHIQNKLTQTMTYLFASLYPSSWQTFFDDFRALAGDTTAIGSVNVAGTILYLRMLSQVNDEIADVLVSRSSEEQRRNTDLKDLVRARDAQKIAVSWQEILAKWRQIDLMMVEMCLRTVSRWVSWTEISLIVNEAMITNFLEMAGQQGISSPESPEGKVRDAAIDTFTEIVGKKMKPADKIELILFLNLGNVVGQLISSPALSELRSTSDYDTDLAETVAKLVNMTVFDIVKVLDNDSVDDRSRQIADELCQLFIPHLLRFFSDEYDEICSTVIPSLTDLLTFFRKLKRAKGELPPHYYALIGPILDAIISKMKYDETASWGEEDEQTDEAEFQELRKRLHVLQQTVAATEEPLYIDTLSRVVGNTFSKLGSNDPSLNWRDLDLALHEMFLFGELAVKNQGLYQKREPSSVASNRLIEMMSSMVESEIATYPHPSIQLQYMEICVRYYQFFEQNSASVPRALENFVRLTHHDHIKVRTRSWYLFLRFVRPLRSQVGGVSQTIIQAIGDLLTIKAELPDDSGDDDMSSDEDDQSADAVFTAQLYLFEAIGVIASTASVPAENKILYARSVMGPLFADMEQTLGPAKNGDERAVLQIHHIIMALGTLSKGFSEWVSASPGALPPVEFSDEFVKASEAILVALESLNSSMNIRTAARSAFSRMIAVLGSRLLQQLPRWIDGLLSLSSTKDEMSSFLRVLGQVTFTFKSEIFGILDTLLTPLLQRIFASLAEPTAGTDDVIQLGELRREYLNFLLILLNQDLGSVLVSNTNQATFDTIIGTLEHFARDTSDYPNGRLSISVLIRMTAVWGGPDKIAEAGNPAATTADPTSPISTASPLPGFDTFAVSRFSPLAWSIPASSGFSAKDPQARQVLLEVAGLQVEIYKKVGVGYLERLREELGGMGVPAQEAEVYVTQLAGALNTGTPAAKGQKADPMKGWQNFFVGFVGRGA
ncbi:Xpo1-domain-containing protein [Mytilinidion resinicola]|uniref:Exportin-T n=1 Tax=Mytilinidion resinicola TaxID=574789 RepID=A0A6A6Z6K2_9PEZI|nr:Xpo1-domain-containing protein [Mytilinidion resinicola]KAF2816339.1 Xpo1-domain-containing protein [Mytilinidion resinicola]